MPLAELHKEYFNRCVQGASVGALERSGPRSRADLLHALIGSSLTKGHSTPAAPVGEGEHAAAALHAGKGIPTARLGSCDAAERVSQRWDHLQSLSESDLQREYRRLGLLLIPGLGRDVLVGHMRDVILWDELPHGELLKECSARGLEPLAASKTCEEDCRHDLLQRLLVTLCSEACEARGVPAKRLGSLMAAAKVMAQLDRLEGMSAIDLNQECERLGIPRDDAATAQLLKDRAKRVLIWRELPIEELRSECRKFSMPTTGAEQRRELVQRLIATVWRAPPQAEAPTRQGAGRASIPAQVRRHFETLGLPTSATANDIKRAYRKLALKYHPDKNTEGTKEEVAMRFRCVTAAYDALSDFAKQAATR